MLHYETKTAFQQVLYIVEHNVMSLCPSRKTALKSRDRPKPGMIHSSVFIVINHETLSLGWKMKILTIEVGKIFHFSLFILEKKFHD